jgi:hypothetical protein
LDDEDRANVVIKNLDKLEILKDILRLAEEKRRLCLEKRWKYKKGSKETILRDKNRKQSWIGLINFKQLGDQVVQYDPGHAVLPWAGIRFRLQVYMSVVSAELLDPDIFCSSWP